MPRAWAASSASANGTAIAEQTFERHPALRNHFPQRPAVDELHRQKRNAVGLLDRVDRDDVGVIERGDALGLASESGATLRVGGLALEQDLEGDVAIEAGVARAIHLAHSAGTDQRQDFVRAETSTRS